MYTKELNERINLYINKIFYYIEYPKTNTTYPIWKYKDGQKKPIPNLEITELDEYRTLAKNDIYSFKHKQKKDKLYEEAYKILMPLLEIKLTALDESWTHFKKFYE